MVYKANGKMRVVIAPQQTPKAPKPLKEGASFKEEVIHAIRHVQDPEIPLNVYDLGLIYAIDADEITGNVTVTMTLTAPNCPVADEIVADVQLHVAALKKVTHAKINLVFDPPWDKSKMSEGAKLELGLL